MTTNRSDELVLSDEGLEQAMNDYLYKLPRAVPAGKVLVHNSVRPTRRLGSGGFRAWLAAPDAPRLAPCDCGFAPELGQHFRVVQE